MEYSAVNDDQRINESPTFLSLLYSSSTSMSPIAMDSRLENLLNDLYQTNCPNSFGLPKQNVKWVSKKGKFHSWGGKRMPFRFQEERTDGVHSGSPPAILIQTRPFHSWGG